ncbi:MAG: rhomboid family intramembrane serine protease [Bacteroidota bacterium]
MSQINSPGRFNLLPVVVKNILIINGLFFLATWALGNSYNINLKEILGLHYLPSEKFAPYQFITYMFMHGDFFHLFFNMFAVWMFGSVMENFWGSKRFLIFYLVTGLGAAVTHYTIMYFEFQPVMTAINNVISDPGYFTLQDFLSSKANGYATPEFQKLIQEFSVHYKANQVSSVETSYLIQHMVDFKREIYNAPVVVGASGSLFGILLAYGMTFPNTMLYVYFAIPIKAKYFVIIYGLLELFSGVSNSFGFSSSNIAHFAHLGGMVFGFLLIMLWRKRRII